MHQGNIIIVDISPKQSQSHQIVDEQKVVPKQWEGHHPKPGHHTATPTARRQSTRSVTAASKAPPEAAVMSHNRGMRRGSGRRPYELICPSRIFKVVGGNSFIANSDINPWEGGMVPGGSTSSMHNMANVGGGDSSCNESSRNYEDRRRRRTVPYNKPVVDRRMDSDRTNLQTGYERKTSYSKSSEDQKEENKEEQEEAEKPNGDVKIEPTDVSEGVMSHNRGMRRGSGRRPYELICPSRIFKVVGGNSFIANSDINPWEGGMVPGGSTSSMHNMANVGGGDSSCNESSRNYEDRRRRRTVPYNKPVVDRRMDSDRTNLQTGYERKTSYSKSSEDQKEENKEEQEEAEKPNGDVKIEPTDVSEGVMSHNRGMRRGSGRRPYELICPSRIFKVVGGNSFIANSDINPWEGGMVPGGSTSSMHNMANVGGGDSSCNESSRNYEDRRRRRTVPYNKPVVDRRMDSDRTNLQTGYERKTSYSKSSEDQKEENKEEQEEAEKPNGDVKIEPTDVSEGEEMKEEETKSCHPNEAETETELTSIPAVLLNCHVCCKNMWDGISFINHLNGKLHQLMMDGLIEKYKLKVNLLRYEIRMAEQQREIELELKQRHGLIPSTKHREYCTICDLHVCGSLVSHQKNVLHQNLKEFLCPKCSYCNMEFNTRLEWDKHLLQYSHLEKVAEFRRATKPNLKDDDFEKDGEEGEEKKGVNEMAQGIDIEPSKLPMYSPSVPVGKDLLIQVNMYKCRVCNCYIQSEEESKLHCRTLSHYTNYCKAVRAKATFRRSSIGTGGPGFPEGLGSSGMMFGRGEEQDEDRVEDLSMGRKPEPPSRVIMPPMSQATATAMLTTGSDSHSNARD
ncbi:uncharacterized protein LOC128998821 [Macrosteles quadrilineatus]|uniref:uncharacterized protein LOC128998821 n=1 Tax=Macrosteles quadrilineatus TaxID=74068 RepID=UPI0023E2280C|nr:uncharacterized protein LOC128998821 [Macrosteles quadrilineatus]